MAANRTQGKDLGFIQINTNRSISAMDLALALAARREAQFVLCSEPNKRAAKGPRWITDNEGNAAITRVGTNPDINDFGSGKGFVWIRTLDIHIYSCYVSPNVTLEVFETFVHDLFEDIMKKPQSGIVVTGDFNSKSPFWGETHEDRRGAMVGEMMATLGLVTMNEGGVPTFVRGASKSVIDLTMGTEDIAAKVTSWEVLEEEESMSPHRFIAFKIGGPKIPSESWRWGPINKGRLAEALVRLTRGSSRKTAEELVLILKKAYTETTGKVRTKNGKIPYWWTDEVRELRERVLRSRRTMTRRRRTRGTAETENEMETYKNLKKMLTKEIKKGKKRAWNRLLEDLNNDVYGDGYKIVKNSMNAKGPGVVLTKEAEQALINKLFPQANETAWVKEQPGVVPFFEVKEVREAAEKLKNRKAPGPDRIPAEVLKVAAESIGEYMTEVYNGLLAGGAFPEIWKKARVVFLEKPRKSPESDKAYRPICLINTAGKLYEALLNKRLVEELESREGLSPQQHGFRKGHATLDAIESVLKKAKNAHRTAGAWCLLALVDVKNAFNAASWPKIIRAIEELRISPYLRNVIKDYLWNREISSGKGNRLKCTVGVPQGSVLGPTLWNIMYDGVLRMEMEEGVSLVAYADDVAVVAEDKNWEVVQRKMQNTVARIQGWLAENRLEMAPEKTELIALKFGRRKREGFMEVANLEVPFSQSAKYLGVLLDTSVSFGPHIRAAAAKAATAVASLSRLMPNIGGPREGRRRTLAAAGVSIMLYAAPIWAGAMCVASYRRVLQGVHRKLALRVSCGYRTVSYDAAVVVASMVPIHLLAEERRRLWESRARSDAERKEERAKTIDKWQEEWDRSGKGRWTWKLIKRIEPWVNRNHGEVDYHLTQWLTGHGSFRTYQKRIGKKDEDGCEFCGEVDTPEHAVFMCTKWWRERITVGVEVGSELTAENIVGLMLTNEKNWKAIGGLIKDIMMYKEKKGWEDTT